jgi:hypothetical protein
MNISAYLTHEGVPAQRCALAPRPFDKAAGSR